MKQMYLVNELAPGVWTLSSVTAMGVQCGRTTFATADAASQVARERDPHAEIEVRPLVP